MVTSAQDTMAKIPAVRPRAVAATAARADASPGTAPREAADTEAAVFTPPAVDSHLWTGDVETQQREGKRLLALLILIVVLLTPFAVWLSLHLSRLLMG